MPRPGRNEPCPCGSGRKVKRCCGQSRGPGEDDLARAFVAHHARDAARELRHLPDDELHDLLDDLVDLPELDLALTITLPELQTPELERLYEVIPTILDRLDTAKERARLAHTVIALGDARRLDPLLAAAAIIDLDSRSQALMWACLIHAAFIDAGIARTPGGLRIAA
jgi:SEC-C motif